MLMMLAWFWASGTPGFGLARAPCEKLGPMMRAREGLMGCCGCFVASVFRKNHGFYEVFVLFAPPPPFPIQHAARVGGP